MHQIGGDFQFSEPKINFDAWDKLITHINARKDKYELEMEYAVPSDYFSYL